jgi:ABC-type Na+ efflux pump permease subunit
MIGLAQFFYRLLPGNPILLRVVATSSKRIRDLIIRSFYLGLLVLIVVIALAGGRGDMTGGNLASLSRTSVDIFERLSYLQLLLVALLAPIFTAAAITQEKDSQTYDILLATPLSNGQIVLGSLMSRMFFIFALLLSGIPIFSITQIFGGVAINDILLSVMIAAVTALVTGALAIAIATFKVGTRRTIFSFYLFNVIYLVGIGLASQLDWFRITLADGSVSKITWLTGLHPFLSLATVLDPIGNAAPTLSQLPESMRGWPLRVMWTEPALFYITLQFLLSLVLVVPSILLLRRMAQTSTTIQNQLLKLLPIRNLQTVRKPRTVWANPIAWREGKTKASAARSVVLRLGFILFGVVGAIVLIVLSLRPAEQLRQYTTANSFNPSAMTLFVHGDAIGTYAVTDDTKVTINGEPASLGSIDSKFVVAETPIVQNVAGAKRIVSIKLRSVRTVLDTPTARRLLLGMIILEVTAILLIVTNAAASTVTREKEDGTLDLLLSTPITSHYYIWGKVRGLVSYVLPLVAVPVASCLIFILSDLVRFISSGGDNTPWTVLPESIVLLPAMLIVVTALASIVGMQMSLRCRTTVFAVMSSIGIVVGVCGFLGYCGYALLTSSRPNEVLVGLSAFSPITIIMLLVCPAELITGQTAGYGSDLLDRGQLAASPRVLLACIGSLAIAGYGLAVWLLYTSMVKNFDMTIRKQSR